MSYSYQSLVFVVVQVRGSVLGLDIVVAIVVVEIYKTLVQQTIFF